MRTFTIDDELPIVERMRLLRNINADIVLMSGGVDGGNILSVIRLAEVLAFSKPKAKHSRRLPVIYAGNREARDIITKTLSDFDLSIVDNIRPDLETMNMLPAKKKIRDIFLDEVMERAPGYSKLKKWAFGNLLPTPVGVERILSVYGEKANKSVAMVDMVGATTDIYSNIIGDYSRTVAANIGMSFSMGQILVRSGVEAAERISGVEGDLIREYAYDKMLFPSKIPGNATETRIERALAVIGMRLAWTEHVNMSFKRKMIGFLDRRKLANDMDRFMDVFYVHNEEKLFQLRDIDIYIGSGGVISHSGDTWASMLMLADAFLPSGISAIFYDEGFKSPHFGLFAGIDKKKAGELYEKEALKQLGHVVAPTGKYSAGRTALTVREEGGVITVPVKWGEVAVYKSGLTGVITPEKGADIYNGRESVTIETGLPVIIDCRGRGEQYDGTWLNEHINVSAPPAGEGIRFDFPVPQIKRKGTMEIEMMLPYSGEVKVSTGDSISCGTVIGTNISTPPRIYIVDVRRQLGDGADVPDPSIIRAGLLIKEDAPVEQGDIIFRGVYNNTKIMTARSPVRGKVLSVEENGTVVLEEIQDYTTKPVTLPVAEIMGIPPRRIRGYLAYKEGDYVEKGMHMIALNHNTVYMRESPGLKAPGPGVVTKIDDKAGTVTIQYQNEPVDTVSWVRGTVKSVISGFGAVIQTEGDIISGTVGFGKSCFGTLKRYSPESLSEKGNIMICDACLDAVTIERLIKQQPAGVIVPCMDAAAWAGFRCEEFGVAVTGDEPLPFTVFSLNGFGKTAMDADSAELLYGNEGRITGISARTQIRAGMTKPYVIIY